MNDSLFEKIQADAKFLNLDLSAQEVAKLALDNDMSDENVQAASLIVTRRIILPSYCKNTAD